MQTRPESIWLSGRVFVSYDARLSHRPFFKRRISDRKYGAGAVHSEKGIQKSKNVLSDGRRQRQKRTERLHAGFDDREIEPVVIDDGLTVLCVAEGKDVLFQRGNARPFSVPILLQERAAMAQAADKAP